MKMIYGKWDVSSMERGQENCYLLTNGLGGFSSQTMIGSSGRNDHAVLMACIKAPNHRVQMVHHMKETISFAEKELVLSSQEYREHEKEEQGFQYLSRFSFEDVPVWLWQAEGVEIEKTLGMEQGENTVALIYRIRNRKREDCRLTVTPWMQFVSKGEDLFREQIFLHMPGKESSNGLTLYYCSNGTEREFRGQYEEYFYSYDACDGRRDTGLVYADHSLELEIPQGEERTFWLIYSMEAAYEEEAVRKGKTEEEALGIIQHTIRHRKMIQEQAGFQNPIASMLAKSADQFIAKRESTDGKTILAGFPFFEDWGRDTMIALSGCCIATKQYETVRSILTTFMTYCKNGLMPNLFPEGQQDPLYNTVDAALLFINAVYLYVEASGDRTFLKKALPVMEEIVYHYKQGTDYGIVMEEDGLIRAGAGLDQVTWMDVRVGEILPTPRHGKPVEINAYWYNALRILEQYSEKAESYGKMADQVKKSFVEKFWMEEKHCLKDVISDTKADTQIRCNQIWAISLPFTMLPEKMEKDVVDTVFEKLYTPYGLRTLASEEEEFCGFYGGEQLKRDLAYHQGTVWTFPLGAYYLAYLKVHGFNEEAKETVREQLLVMEAALREGCIGQLPEIYDGAVPTRSKGCFAQAWSVGEILRVYERLEKQ
jgi:predicted glycogen debranching enzyme